MNSPPTWQEVVADVEVFARQLRSFETPVAEELARSAAGLAKAIEAAGLLERELA